MATPSRTAASIGTCSESRPTSCTGSSINVRDMRVTPDTPKAAGWWMIELMQDLYPLFRSLTGEGNRRTLAALAQHIPVRTHEVATGTRAYDWVVPREWR